MKHKVQFIDLEENDKDLIVSFAIDDPATGIKSLILLRTPFYEELFDEEERGVKVTMEDDHYEQEDFNMLKSINISSEEISVISTFREYRLDISIITESELDEIVRLLQKQNYDGRFVIDVA